MKWSYQIGSIRGIPIKLHLTFLIILLAFIWIFAVNEFRIKTLGIILGFGGMNISTWLKYLWGVIASVLFFSTLLYHELSHSVVAGNVQRKVEALVGVFPLRVDGVRVRERRNEKAE